MPNNTFRCDPKLCYDMASHDARLIRPEVLGPLQSRHDILLDEHRTGFHWSKEHDPILARRREDA
jgi:hypothetical protein